jgi:PPK2 family polyphosphate:nucleotide phosphotransferase
MDFIDDVMIKPGSKVRLGDRDPANKLGLSDKDAGKLQADRDAVEIDRLQDILYAEGSRSLLVVLQGIDTSGKDGTVRSVFNSTGPLGIRVKGFRQPDEEERAHDFLWRVHQACPPRGTIGIFNRSHYEDVLVVKVHKLAPPDRIEERYDQINAFEKMLTENGTRILKFMLHISKDAQRERLEERLVDPTKHWKFNPGDLEDRALWDDFTKAYEVMLDRCSTSWAPWHVIPADRKWVRNAVIARIVHQTLVEMDPHYPVPDWKPSDFKIV